MLLNSIPVQNIGKMNQKVGKMQVYLPWDIEEVESDVCRYHVTLILMNETFLVVFHLLSYGMVDGAEEYWVVDNC